MSHDLRPISTSSSAADDPSVEIRDIHALTPPASTARSRDPWEVASHRSSSISVGSDVENFTTMSREFTAMVVAGSNLQADGSEGNLGRIGEDEQEDTNPLAIVPDNNMPFSNPRRPNSGSSSSFSLDEVSVHRVKKDEVEAKVSAWQGAEIAKINNRFKREDVIINGWESEQVEKATTLFKKIERKLEEKRARAMEKMQNEAARTHRKAEEKRASAEAKRGMKVARVLEVANLLRAVGRAPSKRSFF